MTPSQTATLRNINERPGRLSVAAVGADYAAALQSAGFIVVRGGKCHPTAKAAPYAGRSAAELRDGEAHARATLIGRWGAAL